MLEEIKDIATDDSCLGKTDEKTTDICRAYEILADVAKLKEPLDDDEKTQLESQVIMLTFLNINDFKIDCTQASTLVAF